MAKTRISFEVNQKLKTILMKFDLTKLCRNITAGGKSDVFFPLLPDLPTNFALKTSKQSLFNDRLTGREQHFFQYSINSANQTLDSNSDNQIWIKTFPSDCWMVRFEWQLPHLQILPPPPSVKFELNIYATCSLVRQSTTACDLWNHCGTWLPIFWRLNPNSGSGMKLFIFSIDLLFI